MTQENNPIPQSFLDRQLATSSAAAAIILRGDKVIVKAGKLSADGFRIAESVLQNFDMSDVLHKLDRYVGMSLDRQYHLLFVKNLPQNEMLLSLVFPLPTPLIQIRQDMYTIMNAVAEQLSLGPDKGRLVERTLQSVLFDYPEPDPPAHTELSQTGWKPEVDHPVEQSEEPPVSHLAAQNDVQPINEKRERTLSFGVAPQRMEKSEPPMDMDVMMDDLPWQPIGEQWPAETDQNHDTPMIEQDNDPSKPDESPQSLPQNQNWQPLTEIPHEGDDLISMLQDDFELGRDFPKDEENNLLRQATNGTTDENFAERALEDTAPMSIELDEKSPVETVSDITFYLVPLLDEHYLLGDLSQQLRSWLSEICEIYGWQLDYLLVRPDYIKWTLQDFPESLLREMLTIIRVETSRRIFGMFPNLHEGNPTLDFWSPGYLVDTQNQEFSTQALISRISSGRVDG